MSLTGVSAQRLRKLGYLRQVDPAAHRELCELIFEEERREQKQSYESSFLEFVKRAWQENDPAPLRLEWFQEFIIEHLEAVANGEIRSLLINAPPWTIKSSLVSVLYPAWCWCRSISARSLVRKSRSFA